MRMSCMVSAVQTGFGSLQVEAVHVNASCLHVRLLPDIASAMTRVVATSAAYALSRPLAAAWALRAPVQPNVLRNAILIGN